MTQSDLGLVAISEKMPPGGGRIIDRAPLTGRIGLSSLLVRESVQNAWDARDDDRGTAPVCFDIQGWDLDAAELEHLRSLLPVDDLKGFSRSSIDDKRGGILHPRAVLAGSSAKILVVSDRNTVGLCGPTRSGVAWKPVRGGRPLPRGQKRFANFVRNSGRAASSTGHGDGGAFGVGKSALWMASSCGTVLIHSRTTDESGEPVERFIGCVYGEYFEANAQEFTGRHFIGISGQEEVVEPLVGARAVAAAEGLHIPAYEYRGQPTYGTSVVIVSPRLPLGWEMEMNRLRDAVRWHVWPKLVAGVRPDSEEPDMAISLGWNNHPVDLPDPLSDPEIRPYALTLQHCVKDRASDQSNQDYAIRCGRPTKDLGSLKFRRAHESEDSNVFHLTLTAADLEEAARLRDPDGDEDFNQVDTDPVVAFHQPWGQIALIRREPLLMVRYRAIGGSSGASTFVGVFVSADDPEVEEALTRAEPPAHDDWSYQLIPKEYPGDHRRTFARRTIEAIKSAGTAFVRSLGPEPAGERGSVAVGVALTRGMLGGTGGAAAPPPPPPPPLPPPRKKPRAELSLGRTSQEGELTIHELDVKIVGLGDAPSTVNLSANGKAFDSSGSMDIDGRVFYRWESSEHGETIGPYLELSAATDETELSLLVTVAGNFRFRPAITVALKGAK